MTATTLASPVISGVRFFLAHGDHHALAGSQAIGLDNDRCTLLANIVVRRSGIFDGEGANYYSGLSNNKELYDNWINQLTAQVGYTF